PDEMSAKGIFHQTNGDGSILTEVFREVNHPLINYCRWLFRFLKKMQNCGIRLAGVMKKIFFVSDKYDQSFFLRPVFESKNFFLGNFICSIATNAPNRISWIKDDSATTKGRQAWFNIRHEIHNQK